jgi:hypothetical protein
MRFCEENADKWGKLIELAKKVPERKGIFVPRTCEFAARYGLWPLFRPNDDVSSPDVNPVACVTHEGLLQPDKRSSERNPHGWVTEIDTLALDVDRLIGELTEMLAQKAMEV